MARTWVLASCLGPGGGGGGGGGGRGGGGGGGFFMFSQRLTRSAFFATQASLACCTVCPSFMPTLISAMALRGM